MKKINLIYPLIIFLFLIGMGLNSKAQQQMRISDLIVGDSIRVQSTLGLYYYGYYAGNNDSLFKWSSLLNLENPKEIKINQVAEVILLKAFMKPTENIPYEQVTEKQSRQDITTAENYSTNEMDLSYPKKLPKNKNIAVQIVAGAGAGYLGAMAGGIAGIGIGYLFDEGGYGGPIFGALIGGFSGSAISNALVVYHIGNTKEIKGEFGSTLAGTSLGMLCGLFLYPISPFVASTAGVIAFNKSRKWVKKIEPNDLAPLR